MYTQLSQEERYQIHALMKAGHNQTEIARVLGRHKSTISRELRRNRGFRGYRPKQAHRLSGERRQGKARPRITAAHWNLVETRSRFGDWELDIIIGKGHKQAIVSLTERKSRLTLIRKVERKTASNVTRAILKLLKPFADRVHTLTSDNGKEFAGHETIAKSLGAKFFFAHPHASWERGLNENTNGLIRQYFPKHLDFTTITQTEINRVMDKLNNRPRKCLGIKTPNQVFFGINPPVALAS